jgi:EpsI family protein
MNQQNNKRIIITLVLLIVSIIGLTYFYIPQNADISAVRLYSFPNKIGSWQGKNIKLGRSSYEILNPDGLLFKEYTNNQGDKIQLVVVLGLNKRESFHPPEVCYSGEGAFIDIEKQGSVVLHNKEVLNLNKLVVKNNQGKIDQFAVFWFTANDKSYASYYQQQIAIIMNQLKYRNSWGSLIRISTSKYAGESIERVNNRLEAFIQDVYPVLSEFINPQRGN